MKKLILLILLLLPSITFADTIITAPISVDTTWSPAGGVYILNSNFTVDAGVTLTILPGTIIKANTTNTNRPRIYGTIVAHGTALEPIHFTSLWDDSLGGDTDGGGPTLGSDGRWQGLYFQPGSVGDLDYVDLGFAGAGGFGYGDFIGIENEGGSLTINHSNIHDHSTLTSNGAGGTMLSGTGIWNKSGTLTLTNSIVASSTFGILIQNGTSTISNSIIKNNLGGGLFAGGEGSITITGNTFVGNKFTAQIDASKVFIHTGNTSADISGRGFAVLGSARDGGVLTGGDLPILGGFSVEAGTTYIIAPGTIIKIGNGTGSGAIYVNGTLLAQGTKAEPIYFTSIRDDSVGGDTNGDGSATLPMPKNWGSIFLEAGSKAEFDHSVISYGGFNYNGEYLNIASTIYQRGADLTISNSSIRHNTLGVGLFQDAGTTTITHSEFTDNSIGIMTRGTANIKILDSSLYGNLSQAIYNQGGPVLDARSNWWGDASGPKDQNIAPPTGTGDSISANYSGDILYIPWLTTDPLLTPKINPVIIIPGIMGSAEKNGTWYMDPILHTYDDLIATLIANGYVEGQTLFTFPYQWRDSNVLTATLLKSKISQVKQTCLTNNLPDIDCNKVDLVAHSMGGLVAREYIEHGGYNSDIDQLIFLGTPHKGSPKAYLQWEAGEFPPGFEQFLQKQIFSLEAYENLYPSLFSYIQGRPISSVQELLPVFDYIKDKDTGVLRTYNTGYPRNLFLEALNNATGLSRLLTSGIRITNIVGDLGATSTIDKIRVVAGSNPLWVDGKPDGFDGQTIDRGLERGNGDTTVTTSGATMDNSIPNIISNSAHTDIPSTEQARVYKLLTNKDSIFNSQRSVIRKIFTIRLHSPIDMIVVAPDGKKMGKNFVDGTEYNEIPDAFYSGFNTDEEYITIPNPLDGEYKVETIGTGNGGSYGIFTSYLTNSDENTIEVSGATLPGEITKFKVSIVDSNTSPIDIDLDAPSNSTITISSPESRDYLRSEKINISASAKTGVLSLSLLGKPVSSGTLFDPFFAKLGTTTISASSTIGTKVVATSSSTFRIIASYESTVSDIERAYSLGWIYSLDTKNQLISRINKAIKGEEKIDSLETQKAGTKKIIKIIEKLTKKVDKELLKALRLDLDAYKKDKLSEQAYNIIKEDLDWLILNN